MIKHLARRLLRVDLSSALHALEARVDALQRRVDRVSGELIATPYTSDPSLLKTTDDRGRPAIGYTAAAGETHADVYRGFEDIFRGSEDFIRERQRVYVGVIGARAPVLDVGCGRGEFLDLLRDEGLPAKGIDLDIGMVAHCREKGHDVEQAEANGYLASQPDGSLGAIFSAQMIEHLAYDDLLRFVELAHRKLTTGGVLIAETVNPHSIQAFKTFWVDLTHKAPIFPEVAVALCRLHGFASGIVIFPNGVGDLERDRIDQGEYAVVATR
jgi:O-antigen chain-terminating methyltransferase